MPLDWFWELTQKVHHFQKYVIAQCVVGFNPIDQLNSGAFVAPGPSFIWGSFAFIIQHHLWVSLSCPLSWNCCKILILCQDNWSYKWVLVCPVPVCENVVPTADYLTVHFIQPLDDDGETHPRPRGGDGKKHEKRLPVHTLYTVTRGSNG